MPIDYIFVFMLSFITLIVVIFKIMNEDNKNKRGGHDNGGGFGGVEVPPHIDLPPGICWPDEFEKMKAKERTL